MSPFCFVMLTCFKRRCQFGEWGSQLELAEWQHVMHLKPAQQLHVHIWHATKCSRSENSGGHARCSGWIPASGSIGNIWSCKSKSKILYSHAKTQSQWKGDSCCSASCLEFTCFLHHWEYKFMGRWLTTWCVKVYTRTRPNEVNTKTRW